MPISVVGPVVSRPTVVGVCRPDHPAIAVAIIRRRVGDRGVASIVTWVVVVIAVAAAIVRRGIAAIVSRVAVVPVARSPGISRRGKPADDGGSDQSTGQRRAKSSAETRLGRTRRSQRRDANGAYGRQHHCCLSHFETPIGKLESHKTRRIEVSCYAVTPGGESSQN